MPSADRGLKATWAPGALVPGTVYRVVRPLGVGGMGEVFEVEHDLLGARRALKILGRQYTDRSDLTERLRVEARALARLKHPNLVEVYDLGIAGDGRIFFAMELLEGATLRELLLVKGRLSPQLAVRLISQTLDGLHTAHLASMVHRDIKPENLFVCRDGTVKLLDFGVAKAIDASMPAQPITGVGMTVGTPRYMSPEQAEGKTVDARTDVYAAGLVLWEAIAGRPAFDDPDPVALVHAKFTTGVPRLDCSRIPGSTLALAEAIARACEINPSHRFETAAEFGAVIREALADATNASAPITSGMANFERQNLAGDPTVHDAADRTQVDAQDTYLQGAVGPGGTEVVGAGAGQAQLTERIQTPHGVDPDGLTLAPSPGGRLGPKGTQMLPAVSAQLCTTVSAEPVHSPSQPMVAIPPPPEAVAHQHTPPVVFSPSLASAPVAGPAPAPIAAAIPTTITAPKKSRSPVLVAAALVVPILVIAPVGIWLATRSSMTPSAPVTATTTAASASPPAQPSATAVAETATSAPAETASSAPAATAVASVEATAPVASATSVPVTASTQTAAAANTTVGADTKKDSKSRTTGTSKSSKGTSTAGGLPGSGL